jgi:CRISPR-associated exonuclease Cas4
MLSGIQHIAFCERQYALIYIENQWEENVLTIQGHFLHERVDNPKEIEKREDIITLRSIYLISYTLGLYGRADVIELSKTNEFHNSILLPGYHGYWKVRPVEYKRGRPKPDVCDEVQLCAQAICLEEMYNLSIDYAYIFYGEPRRRLEVVLNDNLRQLTKDYATLMHDLYTKGQTPKPIYKPKCKNCSLYAICQPKLNYDVAKYYKNNLE